ncbi:uncharacterized protein V1510DRAFT_412811 [Dipodascopsis tothii]|uniref:uncharacterized protein n=1 Tax=Dipodascopsis tothii TaxID=44089 RepID=UPI0034CD5BF1
MDPGRHAETSGGDRSADAEAAEAIEAVDVAGSPPEAEAGVRAGAGAHAGAPRVRRPSSSRRSRRYSKDCDFVPISLLGRQDTAAGQQELAERAASGVAKVAIVRGEAGDAARTLWQLPGAFIEFYGHITSLRVSCGLERLPPQIAQLAALEHLDLRGNRLRSLPAQVADLRRLDTLLVDYNLNPEFCEVLLTDYVGLPAAGGAAPARHFPTLRELSLAQLLAGLTLAELDADPAPFRYLPEHYRPRHTPLDVCSGCARPILPAAASARASSIVRYRKAAVAHMPVVLEHYFCSRACLRAREPQWRAEDLAGESVPGSRSRTASPPNPTPAADGE